MKIMWRKTSYRVSQKYVLTLWMTRKPLFINIEWNGIALNTEDKCNWRTMFANVQIDDHYCPDNADNAHQGIRCVVWDICIGRHRTIFFMEMSLGWVTLTCFRSLSIHKFQRCLMMTARFTFSKMEHLPTIIAMYELTLMQLFQTHGLDEGEPLNTLCVPQTSRSWTSFCGDISKTKFIAPNQEQLMHWNWKLKDNVAIFLMTCFVTFVNALVRIISVVWTIMVINLNICKHNSSITFVFCIQSYSISLYVHK